MSDTGSRLKRTLIIQPLPGIGDMVWHMPFIKAISEFDGTGPVDILAIKRSMADQIFASEGYVSNLLWIDDAKGEKGWLDNMLILAKKIRSGNYDRVWVLHKNYRWAMTAWLAGIPERRGYGLTWQRLFLNRGRYLRNDKQGLHPIDKAVSYFKLNGLIKQESLPAIRVTNEAASKIEADFCGCPKPWIAFGIGATDPRRQWGVENFAGLAENLLRQHGGTVLLVGGSAEQGMAGQIKQAMAPEYGASAVGVISRPIPEASALFKACSLFVGNDSGMLHISAAVGTPSIGLFGVKYKRIDTYRLADERRNIFAVFPSAGSDETNLSHMHKISVASVLAKAKQLI